MAWVDLILDRDQVGPDVKAMLDPPDRDREMRRRRERKATRNFGKRSKTPPKIIEQIASEVSAGIPTSHGSQYFGIRFLPTMSQG